MDTTAEGHERTVETLLADLALARLRSLPRSTGADWLSSRGDAAGSVARPSPIRVVVAGRPGAGKGTQGVRLARRLGVRYVSTTELFRQENVKQSPLGIAAEHLVSSGRSLPTDLFMAIVETSVDGRGYVLEGFPRTVAQAEMLFEPGALRPWVAIDIEVPGGVALGRVLDRGRRDDEPTAARHRFARYDTETAPAVALLDRRGLVVRVDGHDSPDAVERNVWRGLQCFSRSHYGSFLSNTRAIGSARDPSQTEFLDRALHDATVD